MEKKLDIGKNAKVRVSWKVKPSDCTDELKSSIVSLMAKKYEIPEKNVELEIIHDVKNASGEDSGLFSTEAKNILDQKFCLELFKQWLNDNGITDYDFDEISNIDSRVNSLLDFSVYDKSKRYKIKWVKWDNFLSYGEDNYFDFTTLKGLVLLNGEPANESGKSTFAYDLLHFLLFGKINPDRAKTNDQLFNNYRKECNEVIVEGCINIDGNDYIIKRVLSRKSQGKSASQKVSYYRLLSDGSEVELLDGENGVAENTAQTNKIIKESLGSEKDFDLIISANAKDLDDLISMGETDRGKLLSRWIGLSPLEDKESKAKEIRKNEIANGRVCDLYNKVKLAGEIEEFENTIDKEKAEIKKEEKRSKEINKELEKLNKERDELLSSKIQIDDSLLKVDENTLNRKLKDIIDEGKANKSKYEMLENEIKEFGDIEFNLEYYNSKIKEKECLITNIANFRSDIMHLKELNKTLSSQEYCPTCGRKFENVDNSGKIHENEKKIKTITEKGISASNEKKKIEEEIEKLDKDRIALAKKSKIELQAMAVKSDINDGRAKYKELNELHNKVLLNKDAIIKNNEIETKINVFKASIKTTEENLRSATYNIAYFKKDIESITEKIADRKAKIIKINEEEKAEKNWNLYLKMVGKDGIGKMVLRHALPIINSELDNLLSDCADFNVEVTINDSNAVEFWLIRDDVRTRLSAASGLEKTQASLALRVVLGQMSRLSCPPFILLDEVLGTVSETNYDNMKKLYDKIVKLYDFVLHITHLSLIQDWHDMTLTIVKRDNISSVKPLIIK